LVRIFFLFFPLSFFSIAHTILFGRWNFWERDAWQNEWSTILVDGKSMFLRNSQCKSQRFIYGCTCVLIIGVWPESQQGSQ
jgi:hypothetical protein